MNIKKHKVKTVAKNFLRRSLILSAIIILNLSGILVSLWGYFCSNRELTGLGLLVVLMTMFVIMSDAQIHEGESVSRDLKKSIMNLLKAN